MIAAEFKLPRRIRRVDRNEPCGEDRNKVAELVRIGPTTENTRPHLLGVCATLYEYWADVWWITRAEVSGVERLDSPADPTPVKQDR